MAKVSIIMPSLNVAKYIRECLDSVIRQTLRDLEIICVDAGSDDGTREILQEYAARDSRIRILDSDRKSYGYQVNWGFASATGEYVGIVETDDYVAPEMFQTLYETAKAHDADFVKSDFFVFADFPGRGRVTLEHKPLGLFENGIRQVSYADYINRKFPIDTFMWNGIYKRQFIEKHRLRLNETPGAAYQDAGFRYQVALLVEKGVYISSAFYHYRRDNLNSSMYSPKGLQYDLQECRFIIDWVLNSFPKDDRRIGTVHWIVASIFLRSLAKALFYNYPNTFDIVREFGKLLQQSDQNGYLAEGDFSPDLWKELRLFFDDPERFEFYIREKAEKEFQAYHDFLTFIKAQEQVVIFGSGQLGRHANFFMAINGILNVVCFCDNDHRKWGSQCMKTEILSPQDALSAYPNAYYLIANRANSQEMLTQLSGMNIPRHRIGIYPFHSFLPFVL